MMIPKGKALQVVLLLLAALAFGGGGSQTGLANLVVQLAGLLVLALNPKAVLDFFRTAPRFPVILVGLALAFPLLQSLPLPPFIWQHLPGRDLVREPLAMLGNENAWFSMSLSIRRTLIAFLSLMPCLAILVLVWDMAYELKRQLLLLVAVGGILVVLLGAQQLATGNQSLMPFREGFGTSDLLGTFSSHNASGVFLDIALCALVGAVSARPASMKWYAIGMAIAALLVTGLILTRSRSSMALFAVPFAFAAYRLILPRLSGRISLRSAGIGAAVLALLAAGAIGLASHNQQIGRSLARFDDLEDRRPLIWADAVQSARRFWPLGSGIGSFDEVFQADESLEYLGPGRAGRAHNDYLEVAVESGLAGLAMLAACLTFLVRRGVQARRGGAIAQAAVASLTVIALQSCIDYPLRIQTLLCVAAVMVALLVAEPERRREDMTSGRGPNPKDRARRRARRQSYTPLA